MTNMTEGRRLSWQGEWRITLFTALVLPVLVSLGFWQLERAAEKELIGERWVQRQSQAPVPLAELGTDPAELAYRRVVLRGDWLEGRDFLLDNRMLQGRYGMEVISPLRLLNSATVVLVNRGWVAGDPARRQLPQYGPVGPVNELVAEIYVPPGEAYTVGEPPAQQEWPRQLIALDTVLMGQMLGEEVYPYTVRLQADNPQALTVDWPLVNSTPEKHRAYATQWFSMAAVLVMLFLVRSTNVWALVKGRKEG